MVDIPRDGLYGDDETADHLWEHRLELYHAQEVWNGPAKYFRGGSLNPAARVGPSPNGR